ncbi:MAG: SMI1/KNR4 family protein [Firmicutes bacterium]|nr:SMI1/KNR4 family protein [Bacillota bacterium]
MLISKFDTENIREKISGFENKHCIKLPKPYEIFMIKYNGGKTPETKFKTGIKSLDIRAFYGIDTEEYDINDLYEIDRFIGSGVLPIACDMSGNYIAIGLGEDNNGEIYFLENKKGCGKKKIADCLLEFISKCQSEEIGQGKYANRYTNIHQEKAEILLHFQSKKGWSLWTIGSGHLSCDNSEMRSEDIDRVEEILRPRFGDIMKKKAIMVSYDNWSGVFIMQIPGVKAGKADDTIREIYKFLSNSDIM